MDESVLFSARVVNGLLAGIYLGFLVAVMPALRAQPDEVFTRVMNQINTSILNPVFLLLFLGSPVLTTALLAWNRSPVVWAATACAVLALLVTVVGNVPLNEALAAGGSRDDFEVPWNLLHAVRTLSLSGAFVLLALEHR